MVPGVLDENVARDTAFTVVRFTATDIGTYAVTDKFENICVQPGADPVYILANADSLKQIFSGVLPSTPCPPGAPFPFTFTMFLDVGRTADCIASHSAVGNAPSVGLAADITLSTTNTPEPTSFALLASGLFRLLPFVRKRIR